MVQHIIQGMYHPLFHRHIKVYEDIPAENEIHPSKSATFTAFNQIQVMELGHGSNILPQPESILFLLEIIRFPIIGHSASEGVSGINRLPGLPEGLVTDIGTQQIDLPLP